MGAKDRTFTRTHPWLTFKLDLRNVGSRLWIALGEAQSKCEHIARVPLRPSTAELLHQVYLAKGALATTAIEGNTLTEEEALRRVQGRRELPPSKDYLGQEIDNIVEACNGILKRLVTGESTDLTPRSITDFNRQVLKDLSLAAEVVPGEVRGYEVSVGSYRCAPAKDCAILLDRLCSWLNSDDFRAPKGLEIVYGLLKAMAAHLYLVWIHPFGDGNGRTARLVEFQVLVACDVPSPAAHLLSNHYNQTRQEYYRQLKQASESGGNVVPFIEYAVQGFLDGLREQLGTIRDQQWDEAWRNYVHETFRDRRGETGVRRRHLVLDLSLKAEPVPISEVRHVSPRVAESYATLSHRTISRDIAALQKEGLVITTPDGLMANKGLILAFLPPRRTLTMIHPTQLLRDES